MIEHYAFGRMQISGKTYTKDLIVHSEGTVHSGWWRASGHHLIPEDIAMVLEAPPQRLVIGTGAFGMMKVDPRVLEVCEAKGIVVTSARTGKAVDHFNASTRAGVPTVGCFHLTC